MKLVIKLYILSVVLSQIYACVKVPDRINYLHERGIVFLLQHLLLPITSFRHKYGFYSLLLNYIPYEVYIKPNKRRQGKCKQMLKYLIQKFNIFIINENVYSIVKKFGIKNMVEFNCILFRVYIKSTAA